MPSKIELNKVITGFDFWFLSGREYKRSDHFRVSTDAQNKSEIGEIIEIQSRI